VKIIERRNVNTLGKYGVASRKYQSVRVVIISMENSSKSKKIRNYRNLRFYATAFLSGRFPSYFEKPLIYSCIFFHRYGKLGERAEQKEDVSTFPMTHPWVNFRDDESLFYFYLK
jgi:hypothetical protein